jgi:thiol-disulfide isomerase/thioredoxin
MKRIFALTLVLLLSLAVLAACGNEVSKDDFETIKTPAVSSSETVTGGNGQDTSENNEDTQKASNGQDVSEQEQSQENNETAAQEEEPSVQETATPANGKSEWFTEVMGAKVLDKSTGSLEWKNSDGKTVNLSNAGGRLYLIDVWAQWCPPCRASTPTMVSLYNKYKDKGLVVLGINTDSQENLFKAQEFATDEGIPYPVLHDPMSSNVSGIYVGQGIPAFTLIENNGRVLFVNEGAITEGSEQANKLETIIRNTLGL